MILLEEQAKNRKIGGLTPVGFFDPSRVLPFRSSQEEKSRDVGRLEPGSQRLT
jgi:hypothetical protein